MRRRQLPQSRRGHEVFNLFVVLLVCLSFTHSFARQPQTPATGTQQPKSAAPLPPPQPSPTVEPVDDIDVVKITTNLVQIDAIVTDKSGKRVTDLRADEVEMLEDGKPKQITNFAYVENEVKKTAKRERAPRTIDPLAPPKPQEKPRLEDIKRTVALVVDDIGLSFDSAYYVRRSLKKFVDEQVQDDDLVAIIRTAGGIGTLQQFTTDRRMLYAAVDRVKWNPRGLGRISAVPPLNLAPDEAPPEENGQTPDADVDAFREEVFSSGTLNAIRYVVKGLGELPGRKSLVLFSDGFTMFSRETGVNQRIMMAVQSLIDQANRSAVVIYTMDARGLQTLGITAADSGGDFLKMQEALNNRRDNFNDSQRGLDYLAASTGGFSIKNSNDLDGGIRKVMEDQQGYYLIGYRPDDTFNTSNGSAKYHHVKLKIKRAGDYKVRMRDGFYGITDEKRQAMAQTPQQQLRNALASPFGTSGVQLKLTSVFANAQSGSFVHSYLHVKASDLTFTTEPDGSHKANFDIAIVTYGDNGMIFDQIGQSRQLTIKDQEFKEFLANGFVYNIRLPIKKAGGYQLRTAIRDKTSSRVGSASQFIEVPDIKKDRLMMSGVILRGVPLDKYLKTPAPGESDDALEAADPNANPAVRQFHTGLALLYGVAIYNAKLDKVTHQPHLKTQVRIFRNGESIFVGKEIPFDAADQKDPKRLQVRGAIQLASVMTPGEYIIQIIATDELAPEKKRVASQWMSFDITK